jgi:hypothetical protein
MLLQESFEVFPLQESKDLPVWRIIPICFWEEM